MNEYEKKRLNKKIPKYFLIFFLFIAIVDSLIMFLAYKSWRGVVHDDAYIQGLNYNEVLEEDKIRKALSLQTEFKFIQNESLNGKIEFSIKDKNNEYIKNAKVIASLNHALQDGNDKYLELNEEDNKYFADINVKIPGKWLVKIQVKKDDLYYQYPTIIRIY